MKIRDVLRRLKADGWYISRMKGSHRIMKHPEKTGIVVLAGQGSKDLPKGTLKSVLKQAGLEREL